MNAQTKPKACARPVKRNIRVFCGCLRAARAVGASKHSSLSMSQISDDEPRWLRHRYFRPNADIGRLWLRCSAASPGRLLLRQCSFLGGGGLLCLPQRTITDRAFYRIFEMGVRSQFLFLLQTFSSRRKWLLSNYPLVSRPFDKGLCIMRLADAQKMYRLSLFSIFHICANISGQLAQSS